MALTSCASMPKNREPQKLSPRIMDTGRLNAKQLAAYFMSRNSNADADHITQVAQYYIEEAAAEGVNSDVAFAQMCLETGYLNFGGLVQPEFHNYCGLGAMDAEHPGEQFETEQLGVRAHIQHLHRMILIKRPLFFLNVQHFVFLQDYQQAQNTGQSL